MISIRRITNMKFALTGFVSLIALAAPSASALAADDLGVATKVQNDVTGRIQAKSVSVNSGNNVFSGETVSTGANARAKLVFKDNANLSVGPNSSVSLGKAASLSLSRGFFHVAAGVSDKSAYQIKTPTAKLGGRGAIFALDVTPELTQVEVSKGQIDVCTTSGKCSSVGEGQAVIVSQTGVTSSSATGQAAKAACGDVCESPTTYAQAQQTYTAGLDSSAREWRAQFPADVPQPGVLPPAPGGIPWGLVGVVGVGVGAGVGAGIAASNNAATAASFFVPPPSPPAPVSLQ